MRSKVQGAIGFEVQGVEGSKVQSAMGSTRKGEPATDELTYATAQDRDQASVKPETVRILRVSPLTGEAEVVEGPGDPLFEWYQSARDWETRPYAISLLE